MKISALESDEVKPPVTPSLVLQIFCADALNPIRRAATAATVLKSLMVRVMLR